MNTDARAQLPSWVRPYVKIYEKFGHVVRDVSQFFRTAQKCMPAPAPCVPCCSTTEEEGNPTPSTSHEQFISLTKASNLDDHVPSLKRKRMDNGVASLCVEYDQVPTSSKKQPASLLDALEKHDKNTGEANEEEGLIGEETAKRLSTLSLQYEKKLMDGQKGGRKKIKIISNMQADKVQDPSEPKKARAASFIATVKQSLSQLNFDTFSRALQQYKTTNDFDAMLSQMSALFAEDQKKHVLLREFYQFVRPQHKKQFDEACRCLTGVACGYKPEHSLPQEKKLVLAKKADKEGEKKTTFSEGLCEQLDSEQHLNKGRTHLTSVPNVTGGNFKCVTDESSKNPSSSLKEDHNQKIRTAYLNDLKMTLDKSSFNSFFSALSAYKKTDDYDAMVSVVAELTTEKPEHFHLLQRFSMFVRPHHKKQFRQMCQELMGTSCPGESEAVLLPAQEGPYIGTGDSYRPPAEETRTEEKAASPAPDCQEVPKMPS